MTDPATALCAWKEHFGRFRSKQKKDDDCVVSAADQRTNALLSQSYNNDGYSLPVLRNRAGPKQAQVKEIT